MKIRRERPSQRLNHRVNAPVRIDTPDGVFKAIDWSLGGFSIEGYTGSAILGDEIACTVHIPFQGFDISFALKAKVMRLTESRELGAAFLDVGDREREIMSHFVDELVRGSMTTVNDAILRIDTPVTPVSTKPDPNPAGEVPLRRRSWKALAMTAFYFTGGLAVVCYAMLVLYTNFFRLEVDTAVVSAPIEPILATTDGRIEGIAAAPGRALTPKARLIVIEDAGLQQKIELARVHVDRATLELLASQKELEAEKEKLRDYRTIALAEIERADARIRSLEKQVSLAGNQKQRFDTLLRQGWTTKSRLDDIQARHVELAGRLEEARSLMHERRLLLDSIEDGRFFNGGKFEGRLRELQVAVDLAADRVMLAKDELSTLRRQKERLVLSAPAGGRLLKLLKNVGSTVKRGERIALFERDEARVIEAYLTQEEILEIGLGDEATIYFPSIDQRIRAFVVNIDRTTGYIDEMESRYEWRGPSDRSARVTLHFADLTADEIRHRFSPGLPAVVVFHRRNTDEMSHRLIDMGGGRKI
jgi:multidrug resistance efflux pump